MMVICRLNKERKIIMITTIIIIKKKWTTVSFYYLFKVYKVGCTHRYIKNVLFSSNQTKYKNLYMFRNWFVSGKIRE